MKTKIIAEIAQGYEGNLNQSKLLVKAASKAKANAVKFQLVYANEIATPDYEYFNLFKDLEMSDKDWQEIKEYSKEQSIELMFDIFGEKSLSLAEKLETNSIKIHGTDLTNLKLLNLVSKSKISTVILGIGGSTLNEINTAVNILENKKLILLQGFQGYPTKTEHNNLSRIELLKTKINGINTFGFADHETDDNLKLILPALAVAKGFQVLEKHLTLGKIMELEDYESALNPDEFFKFVKIIRSTEKSIGGFKDQKDFGMSESESQYSKKIRKHVVSTRRIPQGSILKPDYLTLKRTSSKEFIQDLNKVYNKKTRSLIEKNNPIKPKDIY